MKRAFALGVSLLILVSCQSAPERVPIKPLPETGQPTTYSELLSRSRSLAQNATGASYVDQWTELEETAKSLEETVRLFPKATAIPTDHKDTLAVESEDLAQAAKKLREAAQAKNAKDVDAALQLINTKVRQMRPVP